MAGWIRAVLFIDRTARTLQRLIATCVEELILAWVPAARRGEVTLSLYNGERTYVSGGARFNAGLFDWERRAITGGLFPAQGRILVGGAGGGREVFALAALGYDVVGFEPAEELARDAIAAAKARERCAMVCAEYADVVRSARGEPTPLTDALMPPIDGVILGWGSFSHILDDAGRLELLNAVRSIAPDAPVLLSYLRRASDDVSRTRRVLRRNFARLGCRYRATPGDGFLPWAGFYYSMTPNELCALARAAGYIVAQSETQPYAHAILTPGSR